VNSVIEGSLLTGGNPSAASESTTEGTEVVFHSSHEKKGVAFRLLVTAARVTPVSLLPVLLSKMSVRSIFTVLCNKHHTLYQLTLSLVKELVIGAGKFCLKYSLNCALLTHMTDSVDDSDSRLALASILVQHCGLSFDSKTGTTIVKDLLSGVSRSGVLQHVQALCEVVSRTSLELKDGKGDIPSVGEAEGALSALYSIAKNRNLQEDGSDLLLVITTIFLRISCFGNGYTRTIQSTSSKSSTSKSKKSKKNEIVASESELFFSLANQLSNLSDTLTDAIRLLQHFEASSGISNESNTGKVALESLFPVEIVASARSKLCSLLSDCGQFGFGPESVNKGEQHREAKGEAVL
jgi:hypothetical protein